MTSTQLKTLLDTNLANNNNKEITAAKVRQVITELIQKTGGWADYNNSITTKQTITAGSWQQLTNDGEGALTEETFMPYYTSSMFSDNAVDLSDIPTGTVLTLRNDITLNITSNNTDVLFRVKFKNSQGVEIYTHLYDFRVFKSTGELSGVNFYEFYVGKDILNGSVELEIYADHNIEALWNGCFITIP
jgi:hypothetical protein